MEDGRWKVEDGRRKMVDGRRKREGGRWKAEDGRRKTEDGRRKAEDGSWKTEDGRRKTEGRRRKLEAGRWKVEGGRWKMEGGRWKMTTGLVEGGHLSTDRTIERSNDRTIERSNAVAERRPPFHTARQGPRVQPNLGSAEWCMPENRCGGAECQLARWRGGGATCGGFALVRRHRWFAIALQFVWPEGCLLVQAAGGACVRGGRASISVLTAALQGRVWRKAQKRTVAHQTATGASECAREHRRACVPAAGVRRRRVRFFGCALSERSGFFLSIAALNSPQNEINRCLNEALRGGSAGFCPVSFFFLRRSILARGDHTKPFLNV